MEKAIKSKDAINGKGEIVGKWYLRLSKPKKIWISTTEAAKILGVHQSTILDFIRRDPAFPYRNVGVSKKLQVHRNKMIDFIEKRTLKEKQHNMPYMSSQELFERFGK